MRRQTLMTLALAFGSAGALAQDGSLAGVTMRVVDDISGLDAVVIELDAGRVEDTDGAEADGRDARSMSRAATLLATSSVRQLRSRHRPELPPLARSGRSRPAAAATRSP